VHPIENEAKFPEEWGLDVAAGMLGQAPARFGRKEGAAARAPQAEHDAVREFCKGWKPFDFTAALEH